MSDRDATTAQAALERAGELGAKVRESGRWYVRYLLIFGFGSFLVTLGVGLLHSRTAIAAVVAGWGLVIAALSVYSARQSVSTRGLARRHGTVIAIWATLYGLVLAVGIGSFPGRLGWWLPGALLVGTPALVAAWREARR